MKKLFYAVLILLLFSFTAQAKDKENIVYIKHVPKTSDLGCFTYNTRTKTKQLLFTFPAKTASSLDSSINSNGNIALYLLKSDGNSSIFYWDNKKVFIFETPKSKSFVYTNKEGTSNHYDSSGLNGVELTEDNKIITSNYVPIRYSDKENKIIWKHTILSIDIPKNQVSTIFEAEDTMDEEMTKAGFGIGWPVPLIFKYNPTTKSVYLYYLIQGQLYNSYDNVDKIDLNEKKVKRLAYINAEALAISDDEEYLLYTNKDTFAGNSVNDDNNLLSLKNLKTNQTDILYDEYKENHNEGDTTQGFQIKKAIFINDTKMIGYTVVGIVNYDYSRSFTSENMKVSTTITNINNDSHKVIHDFYIDDYLSNDLIIGERDKWDNDEMLSSSYIAHDSDLILYNLSDNSQNIIEKNVLNFIGAY